MLFFGDQLIAGAGDHAGIGPVGRVTAQCHARGLPIGSCNLGVVGETSVQTTLRLAAEASRHCTSRATRSVDTAGGA